MGSLVTISSHIDHTASSLELNAWQLIELLPGHVSERHKLGGFPTERTSIFWPWSLAKYELACTGGGARDPILLPLFFEFRGTLIPFAMLTQRRRVDENRCRPVADISSYSRTRRKCTRRQFASSPPYDSGPHVPAPCINHNPNNQINATTDVSQATTNTLPTSPDNYELDPRILSFQTPLTIERNRPLAAQRYSNTPTPSLHTPIGTASVRKQAEKLWYMENMLEKIIPFPPAGVPRPHVVTGRELPTYSPSFKRLAIGLALNSRLVLVPGYAPSHWPYISLYGYIIVACSLYGAVRQRLLWWRRFDSS